MRSIVALVVVAIVIAGCRETTAAPRQLPIVRAAYTVAAQGDDTSSFFGVSQISVDDDGYRETGPGSGGFSTRGIGMSMDSYGSNFAALRITFLHDLDVGTYRARVPGTASVRREFLAQYVLRTADGAYATYPITEGVMTVMEDDDDLVASFTMTADAVMEQRLAELTRRSTSLTLTGTLRVPLSAGTRFGF